MGLKASFWTGGEGRLVVEVTRKEYNTIKAIVEEAVEVKL